MTSRTVFSAQFSDAAIFACDAAHLPYAWVAARQIDRMEPGRRFDILIASPDTDCVPAHLRDGPIRWITLDVSKIPCIRHPNARITLATFYRHLLPELLQHEYARLFYMDTDTWQRRSGLQDLFDSVTGDWPLARQGGLMARFDPFIIHFAGAEKSWLITDDPAVNQAWFSDLRIWDPGFVPQPAKGSLAWRALHPRFGLAPLNAVHAWLRAMRLAWKRHRAPRMGTAGAAAMQQMIDAAEFRSTTA